MSITNIIISIPLMFFMDFILFYVPRIIVKRPVFFGSHLNFMKIIQDAKVRSVVGECYDFSFKALPLELVIQRIECI